MVYYISSFADIYPPWEKGTMGFYDIAIFIFMAGFPANM